MSDLMTDIGSIYGEKTVGNSKINIARKGSNTELDMTDFIQLMITQLTNQGIDENMDTSQMLTQMVQMQMIQSMVNMTDATTMNYAASLVGKEVTVGKYDDDGKLQELVGTVTATGTKDGQQVIFVNDEYYYLNELMAVGRLPEPKEEESEDGEKVEGTDKTEGADQVEKTNQTEGTNTDKTVQPGGETPKYNGEDGAPENSGE